MLVAILTLVLVCVFTLRIKNGRPPLASGAWPVVGHAIKLITSPEEFMNYIMVYSEESIQRDAPLTVRVFVKDIYYINDPTDANIVLNSCLQKDVIYDSFKPWLGDGLIAASETVWKKHRKLLNPTFNQCVLDSYLAELNKQAISLVKNLDAKVGKGKFNHAPYLEHTTLQTICSTAMGVVIDEKDVKLREQYLRAKSQYSTGLTIRGQRFWMQSEYIYNFTSLKKTQRDLASTLHSLTQAIIKKRKEESYQLETRITKRFKPFMEHLLDMEKDGILDTKEVQEEVDTFVFAGSDTMSVTLTTTLLVIGTYPEIQRKIVEELQEVFQGSLRDVEKQDLLKLRYLEAVVKETLRLYPTIPIIGRTLESNVKIRNFILPAGSRCFVSLYGANRHGRWGPDADQFRPERWLEPDSPLGTQFAAFGFGKRRCIGSTFAVMCVKTILAHVLRHYRVLGDVKELRRTMEVVARPVPQDYITIERRTKTEYVGQN